MENRVLVGVARTSLCVFASADMSYSRPPSVKSPIFWPSNSMLAVASDVCIDKCRDSGSSAILLLESAAIETCLVLYPRWLTWIADPIAALSSVIALPSLVIVLSAGSGLMWTIGFGCGEGG